MKLVEEGGASVDFLFSFSFFLSFFLFFSCFPFSYLDFDIIIICEMCTHVLFISCVVPLNSCDRVF